MLSTVIKLVCDIPVTFTARGNVSVFTLLQESGYAKYKARLSEQDIAVHLREHPSLISAWVGLSEDQRCTSAWYLVEPNTENDGNVLWKVGYINTTGTGTESSFIDSYSACAYFVMKLAEQVTNRAG